MITIVGFLLIAIIATINGAPQYTWEDLSKNVKPLPPDSRHTDDMSYNRRMNKQYQTPTTTHETHQEAMMDSSSDKSVEQKHPQNIRLLTSSNGNGKMDTKSIEHERHDMHVYMEKSFVPRMILEDNRSKHDIKQNIMNFLNGQPNYDDPEMMENSKNYLTKTILEELPRYGIQSSYYGQEHKPRFMAFQQKMEPIPKAVQPQRLPTEETKFMDMNKSFGTMNSVLADGFNTEPTGSLIDERETLHTMKIKRNSQENLMDSMAMMQQRSNSDDNSMPTIKMHEQNDSNLSNHSSQEQSQHYGYSNMMVENEMRPRNQKSTITHDGQGNNDQMMNTIYRN